MSTVVLLSATALGLGALYFLVAAGLSLIFGLADVLNFAHGVFLAVGAYGTWWAARHVPGAGAEAGSSSRQADQERVALTLGAERRDPHVAGIDGRLVPEAIQQPGDRA